IRAERMDGENLRSRSNAHELAMRHDRARHSGAMRVRPVGTAYGIESLDQCAGEIGMPAVDLGVDHRDQHIAPGCNPVDLSQMKLAHHVLAKVAAFRASR